MSTATVGPQLRAGTPAARWVLGATVLGSGIAFLDGTVVTVALPTIADDLDAGLTGLQWTLDAYLVTLSALLLLGGSLGDKFGRRRIFVMGLVAFSIASLLCALAPTIWMLVAARALQGVGGAMLVPGSLAIISASFHPDDRSWAVGVWSGLSGVSTALGPFLGGWLIDQVSWRWIFIVNLPLAAVAVWITVRHVPETRDPDAGRPDIVGATAASLGLAAVAYALIEGAQEIKPSVAVAAVFGVVALVAFVVWEAHTTDPMLPLGLFRSRQFSGANATTFAVYGGLGGATFLLVLELQMVLGYSALEAGASLLPLTVMMLLFAGRAGRLAQRIGPRLPMTVGPLVMSGAFVVLAQIDETSSFLTSVLPGAFLLGAGLALTVAPLTAAVLAAVEERHLGVGSGVNNAVARLAGLVAVAILPGLAGIDIGADAAADAAGFSTGMQIAAVVCAAGSVLAFATIRRVTPVDAGVTDERGDRADGAESAVSVCGSAGVGPVAVVVDPPDGRAR